jgi:hypothetical protein
MTWIAAGAAAIGLMLGSASASLVYVGTFAGNDGDSGMQTNVNTLIAPDTTSWLAKINYNDSTDVQTPEDKAISASLFALTINADENSGTVNFDLSSVGYVLEYVVLKGGPNFALFQFLPMPSAVTGSFTFDLTGFLIVGQGNTPNLSHISFYGDRAPVSDVPLPAAIWLMGAGIAGLGFASRKSKKA